MKMKLSYWNEVITRTEWSVLNVCTLSVFVQSTLLESKNTNIMTSSIVPILWPPVLYLFPVYSFSLVFLLFLFQHQLDEQLLKLFIAVVDAQLLKTVAVKDFKAVDIQYTDYCTLSVLGHVSNLNSVIDTTNNPWEKAVINRLKIKNNTSNVLVKHLSYSVWKVMQVPKGSTYRP